MLTDGSLQLQQHATTRSLQSSDVVDEEESIVSVVDLGWARTRSGRRSVTRSGRHPITKQVGLGEKKKKKGLGENKKRLSSRGSPVTKQIEANGEGVCEGLNNNLKNKKLEEVQSTPDAKLPRKSPSIPGSGYSENQS
ncbi:hypothetical protein WN944_015351 [Citrus x changshan-huyou]|uniref:Uncharacterized protein n=1 Tax=Citrus x changshan-huyou TaxID=2935761 RepID=A0AAP0MCD2_9ROSI